jgi:poly(3-hydroxybutyrate) depolymerase
MGNIFDKSLYVMPWNKLLPMGADPTYTTISGFSSGAFMTDIVHVVHSETFKGAALLAGGPWITQDLYGPDLMVDVERDVAAAAIVELTDQYSADGKIDDTSNLENHPVFLA